MLSLALHVALGVGDESTTLDSKEVGHNSDLVRVLVGLPEARDAKRQLLDTLVAAGFRVAVELPFLIAVDVPRTRRPELDALPNARWVNEEQQLRVEKRQATDCFQEQWPLTRWPEFPPNTTINVEDAWTSTTGFVAGTRSRVRLAIVDDGIEPLHPEFFGRIVDRANFSGDRREPGILSVRDNHGTQTAGVAAAARDGVGVTGVCPDCALLSARLLGDGGPDDLYEVSSLSAAAALTWAVDRGAAVINNSWGPPDGNPFTPDSPRSRVELPPALSDALSYAVTQGRGGLGTVIVWSAGNGGEPIGYDGFASDPRVVAVGSIDVRALRAVYSDYGLALDLVTPSSGAEGDPAVLTTDRLGPLGASARNPGACTGADLCSEACLEDFTDAFGGTSASAAHVAGAAALIVARYPTLSAAQVIESLLLGARPLDRLGREAGFSPRYGFGLLDVAASMAIAETVTSPFTRAYELCGNGIDDNNDGRIDEECVPCVAEGPEVCDGADNDCDGFVDPGYTCRSVAVGLCGGCRQSADCEEGLRCRGTQTGPGTYCFPRCDSGEACPTGTVCVEDDVCDLVATSDSADCYAVVTRTAPVAVSDPVAVPQDPSDSRRGSEGCATGSGFLSVFGLLRRRTHPRARPRFKG